MGAFDRQTCNCWGGGAGLGFGRSYQTFPGGEDCFCAFLADGNERTEQGRQVGEMVASWRNRQTTDDFQLGERYLKDDVECVPDRGPPERQDLHGRVLVCHPGTASPIPALFSCG